MAYLHTTRSIAAWAGRIGINTFLSGTMTGRPLAAETKATAPAAAIRQSA